MAQKSKKSLIAAAALPLFLENGFKGTSIDMVVKKSQVSKATVYNHFADKSALMQATLALWIKTNKPLIAPLQGTGNFDDFVHRHWLTSESVRMYALVIGEGWRFPDARQLFWEKFDRQWRKALDYLSKTASEVEQAELGMRLDHHLFQRLKQLDDP